jgi:hypothetical protein
VINLSMGILNDKSENSYNPNIESSVQYAINYASEKGATIIAASGNNGMHFTENGSSFLRLFADFQSVLPINACGPKGWFIDPTNADFYQLTSYSDYGRASEFCAPGGQIDKTFTDATASCAFGDIITAPCWLFDRVLSTGARGSYYWTAGTSMAAPHASGVAALIISENPSKFKGRPSWVRAEMRKRAVDKGESGHDGEFGYGFVQSGYSAAGRETAPVDISTLLTSDRSTTIGDLPPSGSGGTQGDPHFKTWRGEHFDYHGECDLVLLHSSEFGSGLGLDVHIRTKFRRDMSYVSGATVRIGTDILEVDSQGIYFLNGEVGAELPDEFSGFAFSHTQPNDKQHVFEVHLGGSEKIYVKTYKDFVSVLIEEGQSKNFGDSTGLMGDFQYGVKLSRDGKTVIDDANAFGQEWQVRDTEPTLFQTDRLPQYPLECTLPTPVQASQLRRRLLESSADALAAEKACAHWGDGKDDCVFDVLTTGDLEMAVVGAY